MTVELGMLREENSELTKNLTQVKGEMQERLDAQKKRHDDAYN